MREVSLLSLLVWQRLVCQKLCTLHVAYEFYVFWNAGINKFFPDFLFVKVFSASWCWERGLYVALSVAFQAPVIYFTGVEVYWFNFCLPSIASSQPAATRNVSHASKRKGMCCFAEAPCPLWSTPCVCVDCIAWVFRAVASQPPLFYSFLDFSQSMCFSVSIGLSHIVLL